ncbi:hypothetical protein [Microvirga sp. VF16]|uniref:hypothetical protein n=1 Tax=Microvirga sp. VF16 TaxID=2807101 RepID=UPI00193CA263|nr:hypothetical protein [Microvirga sp. VF16]QRM34706.1 hypothetical protein JO965_41250 [Microvirga sp. VF16]
MGTEPGNTSGGRGSGLWRTALRRYLIAIALGNLAWEFAHMPLYTIWATGTWREIIVVAAVHCAGGDILIALSPLMIALLTVGSGAWPLERFRAVATLTIVLGIVSTAFSDWLNIVVRAAWTYADLMPTLSILGFHVGLSPLMQWVVIPLVAFAWAGLMRVPTNRRQAFPKTGLLG